MDMNHRLRQLEKLTENLEPDPGRCPACEAFVPSVPVNLLLYDDGRIAAGGPLQCFKETCPECQGIGGQGARQYDPDTGVVRGFTVTIIAPHDGRSLTLDEWDEKFGEREHGPPWDAWFEARRRGRAQAV